MDVKETNNNKRPPHILLALTGSVATIRCLQLYHQLCHIRKEGEAAEVKVVATSPACFFFKDRRSEITPVVLLGKTNPQEEEGEGEKELWKQFHKNLYTDQDEWNSWKGRGSPVLHIELKKWADILVIAPLDASTLAKVVHGMADNLLTSLIRAWDVPSVSASVSSDSSSFFFDLQQQQQQQQQQESSSSSSLRYRPIVIAPAMNTSMWAHPLTAQQILAWQRLMSVEKPSPFSASSSIDFTGPILLPSYVKEHIQLLQQQLHLPTASSASLSLPSHLQRDYSYRRPRRQISITGENEEPSSAITTIGTNKRYSDTHTAKGGSVGENEKEEEEDTEGDYQGTNMPSSETEGGSGGSEALLRTMVMGQRPTRPAGWYKSAREQMRRSSNHSYNNNNANIQNNYSNTTSSRVSEREESDEENKRVRKEKGGNEAAAAFMSWLWVCQPIKSKVLMCGDAGAGAMAEVTDIVSTVKRALKEEKLLVVLRSPVSAKL